MNLKLTALTLAAATTFAFTPKPAQAGDQGLAIVGGLIGGLIIGSAIADHDDGRVVYANNDRCDDGYWNTVSVNVWVPGYWITERDHWGRPCRRWVGGHNECRTNRVWVAYDRHGRDYRRDRYVSRGNGRDRDWDDRRDHRREHR